MRAAINTTRLIACTSPAAGDIDFSDMRESLEKYLTVNQPQDETLFPDELPGGAA